MQADIQTQQVHAHAKPVKKLVNGQKCQSNSKKQRILDHNKDEIGHI